MATTPIISAVGHETDFTICDFVSDMRAPTPSAAAELAVPDKRELLMRIDSFDERLSLALKRNLIRAKERLDYLKSATEKFTVYNLIKVRRDALLRLNEKANLLIRGYLDRAKDRLLASIGKANALSPLSILSRGYSIAESDGRIIKSISELKAMDSVEIILSDGSFNATVTDIIKGESKP